ncbi:hypothetical protein RI129_012423 [Pyrocoelia pectoralis]|uniref:C2H2-type domain-containing protein n=1 Tax=Pyrocoelia pectoralis TaxID=417401 RepID=A0AAN7UZA1_9COLE
MDDKVVCNGEECKNETKAKKVAVLIKGAPTEVNIVPFKSLKDVFKSDIPPYIKLDIDPTFHCHAVVLIPSEFNCDVRSQYYNFKLHNESRDTNQTKTDTTFRDIEDKDVEVTSGANRNYKCPLCNYTTLLKGNMKVHQLKHSGERKFECEHCSYKATQKSCLKTHVLLKHSNPTKLQCTKCDYKTALKGNLKKHFLIHSGEKNFQCPECPFRATQKSTVNTHLNLIHHKSKDMIDCLFCDYKTLLKGNMKVHELRHTEDLTM